MKTYTVTQKILSLGATYLVRAESNDTILYTIKGKILTFAPKLEMKKGEEGTITKLMKGNFFSTNFTITDTNGNQEGVIQFPFFSFIAKFTLTIGTSTYNAKGGFTARKFSCMDEAGNVKFTISKEIAFRDKFTVSLDESVPEETAILAAVAIDQRFFQQRS